MELRHYIYGIVVLFVVGIVIFVVLWTRNVLKATIVALTTTLGGFLIGSMVPGLEAKVTSNREKILPWLNLQVEYITFTPTPPPVAVTSVIVVAVTLIVFGVILHLDNKDERKHRQK